MSTGTAPVESSEIRIPVVLGRVACPRIGSVDLDRCRECPYLSCLEEMDAGARGPAFVVCSLTTVEQPDMVW